MKTLAKIVLGILCIAVLLVSGYGINYAVTNGPNGTGYTAKMLCSSAFVSEREPESIWAEDLWVSKKYYISAEIDKEGKSVTSTLPGPLKIKRRAIYREGLGCALVIDTTEEKLREQGAVNLKPLPVGQENMLWPTGDRLPETPLPPQVDMKKINKMLDDAFSEPDPENPRRTRAVVIVYDGSLIAERYAPGFSKDMRLIGWSMTKSVNSALIGIMVGKGKLSVDAPAPVPEWIREDDPRRAITLDQLLRMSSGLEFLEEYESNPSADAAKMFFSTYDMAGYAANKPLEVEPGSKWYYSSGTSNMLARIIRHTLGGTYANYVAFPRRALFDRIGMRSAIIETDPSGTFVGAGLMYATARDWARFGLLYLNDGLWEGRRILPAGWVKYTTTPTAHTPPEDGYGAQFWLNTGTPPDNAGRWMPKLPADIYSARGHEGQYTTIIPSRKLVVVRLGNTVSHRAGWDHQAFLLGILDAIQE